MLSEVWKTIRDDDGFDITRVTETEMMGTNAQDRHGLFNKPVLEFDQYSRDPDARIWKIYVREADKFDIELVDGWNRSLDVTLIFAALFTAICTMFVIESSKSLKENPVETVGHHLNLVKGVLHVINNVGDDSQLIPELWALISPDPFEPRSIDMCVNILWFFSLILSVAVSIIAMLAKKWSYIFVSDSIGDPWSQMKRRQQHWKGIEKWNMKQVIMVLPSFIHLSFLSFAIGLCIYLADMNKGTAIPVALVTLGSILIYVASTIFPFLNLSDTICPYSTSISRFIQRPGGTAKKTAAHESRTPEQHFDLSSLDGMLIFAALFSFICTAFLIESSESLQTDSIETLARQSEQKIAILSDHSWLNPELRALISLDPFSPRPIDLYINILWFFSLILSATVSLIAMLAKEWCYIFVSDSMGDPWSQTKRRQQRWEGMKKWKMEQVIMILPSFIHLSFLSFAIGLCIYLVDVDVRIGILVTSITLGSILIYVASTIFPFLDLPDTIRPYSTYISRFIQSLHETTKQIAAYEPNNVNQTAVEALARLINMSEDPKSMDIALQATSHSPYSDHSPT
ncbi:GPI ethanolamine phosphate transferase 1 [Rhizoctonia solani]|uniref:GPI ethanolamine phosphate transferase 1 n=1 Tax=Rhizoctonia solani TaxID=456999 RepID=A0A0K6FXU7_9AGAM|nr:GPI ethanolamine phosphate transferase 1 [Rhizoctonia solani]